MKKALLLISILLTSLTYAQKLPKIKGSKNVVISERKFDSVKALTVYGRIKLNLIQSDSCKLVINADGNLHKIVGTTLDKGTLSIELSKRIVSKKHFELNFYIDSLSVITLMEKSRIEALGTFKKDTLYIELNNTSRLSNFEAEIDNIIISSYDNSKIEAKIKTKQLDIKAIDNSKISLNNSNSDSIHINSSDKSKIEIIGTTEKISINANDASRVDTKDCIATDVFVNCSESSIVTTLSEKTLHIKASQKSEIHSYGKGQIIIEKFNDTAVLRKKE